MDDIRHWRPSRPSCCILRNHPADVDGLLDTSSRVFASPAQRLGSLLDHAINHDKPQGSSIGCLRAFLDHKSLRPLCRGRHVSRRNQGFAQCLLSPRLNHLRNARSRITSPAFRNDHGCVRSQASRPYLAMGSCRWEGIIGGEVLQGVSSDMKETSLGVLFHGATSASVTLTARAIYVDRNSTR